jgi:hypothetical protein
MDRPIVVLLQDYFRKTYHINDRPEAPRLTSKDVRPEADDDTVAFMAV